MMGWRGRRRLYGLHTDRRHGIYGFVALLINLLVIAFLALTLLALFLGAIGVNV